MAASKTFLQTAIDSADRRTYTFASQNIGAADPDRYIVCAVAARAAGGSAYTVDSVTIGGISASDVVQISHLGSNGCVTALFIAAVPTGTTADVVVVMSKTSLRAGIALWSVTGIDSVTANDTDTDTTDNPTLSIDIPSGGIGIAVAAAGSCNAVSFTGLTDDFDQAIDGNAFQYGGASDEFASVQTGMAVDATLTPSTGSVSEPVGAVASWGTGVVAPSALLPATEQAHTKGSVAL